MLAYFRDQLKTTSLTARLACLLFLGLSLLVTWRFTYFSGYDGGGWVRTTLPLFVPSHWLLGFGAVYQGNLVIHNENLPYIENILRLSGGRVTPDKFYAIRGLHPLLGSLFAPLLGAVQALLLLNYLYWALAAYVAWRFTLKLFNDERAALLVVLFVLGGIGWLTHISDLSPHLSSYSFCFLLTLFFYESRIWQEQRPLRIHLLCGVLLALALLNYQTGMVLLLFYLAVSLRYNRLLHVLAGALVGLSANYLWAFHLSYLDHRKYDGPHHWYDYLHHTPHTLRTGFIFLQDNLHTPSVILAQYAQSFVQLLFALESLPLVLLGLLSWWALRRNRALCWFFAAGFFLQVGAVVPQFYWPAARGAYTYGATLLLLAPASYGLARLTRTRGVYRWLGWTAVVLVLSCHFYWGAAQFWGNAAPLGVYQATVLEKIVPAPQYSFIGTEQPLVLSLTGAEPTPYLYWGKANMLEAGALPVPAPVRWAAVAWQGYDGIGRRYQLLSIARLILDTLEIRLTFLLYFTALLFLLISFARTQTRRLTIVLLVWLSFWLGAAMLAALGNRMTSGGVNNVVIPPGGAIRYSLQLSATFLQQLEKQLARGAFLEGFTLGEPGGGPYHFRLSSGGVTIMETVGDTHLQHFPIPVTDELGASFVDKLKQHKELTIEYRNHGAKDMLLYGWQRAGLPDRQFTATPPLDAQSARALPAFELRVRPRQPENRTLYLIGF